MAKTPCDCAKGAKSPAAGAVTTLHVVNAAGMDLGPFNWETAVGSDIARGSPPAAALQRGQVLRNIVLASGESAISTDAIRYVMEGTRHLGAGEQLSGAELEKFSAYLKRTDKPKIEITPSGEHDFGPGPRWASIDAPMEGFVVTAAAYRPEPRPLVARSLKRHVADEVPTMLNAALLVNMRRGFGDPFPAFRPGKRDGVMWGDPNPDGSVDEDDIDLPGAPDEGDVWIRTRVGVPRHGGCEPVGDLVCKKMGTVFRPIRSDPPIDGRIEFGAPQVTVIESHTVKVVISMTLYSKYEVYEMMYRRFDCCCEYFTDLDCWTELEYIGDTPKDIVEEPTILPPLEHVSRDWSEWTLDLFKDMAKRAAEAAGGGIGTGVGGLAGDALKDALQPVIDEAKRLADQAVGALGFGGGGGGGGTPGQ